MPNNEEMLAAIKQQTDQMRKSHWSMTGFADPISTGKPAQDTISSILKAISLGTGARLPGPRITGGSEPKMMLNINSDHPFMDVRFAQTHNRGSAKDLSLQPGINPAVPKGVTPEVALPANNNPPSANEPSILSPWNNYVQSLAKDHPNIIKGSVNTFDPAYKWPLKFHPKMGHSGYMPEANINYSPLELNSIRQSYKDQMMRKPTYNKAKQLQDLEVMAQGNGMPPNDKTASFLSHLKTLTNRSLVAPWTKE